MNFVNVIDDFERRVLEQINERLALGHAYSDIASTLQFNANRMQVVLQALQKKDYLTPFQSAIVSHITERLEQGEAMTKICQRVSIEADVLRQTHQVLRRREPTVMDMTGPEVADDGFHTTAVVAKANTDADALFSGNRRTKGGRGSERYQEHFASQVRALEAKDKGVTPS